MEKRRSHAKNKRAQKKSHARRWHLPHLMVAAGIIMAFLLSIPVGAYIKASVLVADEAGNPPPPPPANQPPPPPVNNPPPAGTMQTPPPSGDQEAKMRADCLSAGGTFQGMSAMPPCLMPGMNANNMQNQNPSGTVPTIGSCQAMGMGWNAAMSQCMPSNGMQNTQSGTNNLGDCGNPSSTTFATPACTQLRANQNNGNTMNTMRPCAANEMPTMTNPCAMGASSMMKQCNWSSEFLKMATNTCMPRSLCLTKGGTEYDSMECKGVRGEPMNGTMNNTMNNTPPAGMIECSFKTPSGTPMYGKDQNQCAQFLAEQVKWQQNQNQPTDTAILPCPNANGRAMSMRECNTLPRVNMNAQPCPTFPTPNGMTTSMAPCSTSSAQFQQPMFDAGQFQMQNGPQFNFDYNQLNKQWNVDLSQTVLPQMDFSKQQAASEVKRLGQQGRQILSQIKQMSNEVDRVVKRSGNLSACPPIAKAQAGISTATALAQLLTNATANNLSEALAASQQLGTNFFGGTGPMNGNMPMNGGFNGQQGNFGPNNFGPNNFSGPQSAAFVAQSTQQTDMGFVDPSDTIMFKLGQSVSQSHMCEGITFFAKDGKRFIDDIDRMSKQTKDAATLAKLTALKVKVQALVNDPYARVSFDDLMPGEDPMQDLVFEMQDLRQEFGDIMQDFQQNQEEQGVCGALDGISQALGGMKSQVPADLFGKASRLVSAGLSACKKGDTDAARESMSSLERLKGQFMKYVNVDGNGDAGRGNEEDNLFADLDTASLLKTQGLDDDMINKITDRLLEKMQNKIDAAVNAATQPLMKQIATLESRFATDGALATRQAASIEYTAALPDKIQKEVASDRGEILAVVTPLDAAVSGVVKQLSTTVQDQYKRLLDDATTRTCSAAGCEEIKKAIDAVNTAAESAGTAAERAKILSTEIPTALSTVDQILKSDKDAAFKEGRLAFKDQDETQWHAKYLAEAKDKGLFTGDNANADRATNVAEGVVILARAAAGGNDGVTGDVDLGNTFVRQMPEWARPAATYLINEKGVDLAGIMGKKTAEKPMTRIEMVRAAAGAFDLRPTDTSAVAKFKDVANLPALARDALAALAEAGVVSGQGTTGNFDPNGTLNRAAFIKITLGAEAAAQ